ncbi:hypothetical protein TanjilG_30787 [Lupinus angustifolius]|uniref:Subtilisin-like protease n=1 Tax=Lupinus angustifolius TaxID=3871 RepID=A0A394DN01_LUPAN|nr:PREDICTED: subtilisin-like protease SBT1.8 [Lupinus angustifolius]OIW21191.1 hypothetical protein TanjilG_30787 [Lupinus angustifolius]
MSSISIIMSPFFVLLILSLLSLSSSTSLDFKSTYIVHINHQRKPDIYSTHYEWYTATLSSLSTFDYDPNPLLYTYTTAYSGFAASLTSQQVDELLKSDSVIDIYQDTVYQLHTTRTPEFLGLQTHSGLPKGLVNETLNKRLHDIIIGVLDTGVWPESKSFDDTGMPDIPKRWHGECESGKDFASSLCNKKLIGARSFFKGSYMAMRKKNDKGSEIVNNSPRDTEGHGTHTASTAAGSHVANASFYGYASGIARGMAPQARVASYKVCWEEGCFSSDILAGMERAIEDGVDVLSLSIGGLSDHYFRDAIAIGAFAATKRGIFVSCSAGNSGPEPKSLSNVAPWITTVGAGTLDRDFPAYGVLGNKNRITGVSLYSGKGIGSEPVGLVYNKGVKSNQSSSMCTPGSLDPKLVRGKVVVCDRGVNARVEKGLVVKKAGGVGMILANTAQNGEESIADRHVLPAMAVGEIVGDKIREYVGSDPNPTVVLSFGGTVLDVKPAPVVAAFSSRGPNNLTPQILKPDVIGPGVNILAGWTGVVGPSTLPTDTGKSPFNIVSGTSMSCPHISGLAALIKAAHPKWSPSAIKSALMTTAYTLDNTNTTLHESSVGAISTPWAHGAGHVDPQKALSPGLIYDTSANDYITFLCSLNYSLEQIQMIAQNPNVNCSRKFSDPGQLNYPSFSILFGSKNRVVRYTRTVTNVGDGNSVYNVIVDGPSAVSITVKPSKLVFGKVHEKKRYTVTFVSKKGDAIKDAFGSISWINSQHQVRSPVAFTWSE